jgi:hypothetical protein
MNDNQTPIEALFEKAEDYSKTTLELFKLNAIDKTAEIVSSLAVRLAILLAVVLFVLVLNIGVALWIGELLGKTYYGFFVVAGIYALITILLYVFRNRWIRYPVSNAIITQMLKKK